jgi:DNA-binding response OmpR family regulator
MATVPAELEPARPQVPLTWKGEGTILIVDDDPTVRAVMARMVEGCGFDVLQAVDGRHALEVFSENSKAILAVILDMTMPNLNGREALKGMRDHCKDVRVLMVSGFSENCSATSFLESPPNAFLQKPFKREELIGKLNAILSSSPAAAKTLTTK